MMLRFSSLLAVVLTLGLMLAGAAARAETRASGNPFAPVILVNDLGITGYEIDQRMKFMALLRQGGDLRAAAEKSLIEDRLRTWQARQDGVVLAKDAVSQGMSEFAGRANLSTDQFIAELAKGGVSAQSFRDFVTAGLVWREVVRARFAPRVRITEGDIDRAMAMEATRGLGTRVLMSEFIIPAPPEHEAEAMAIATRASQAKGEGEFGALAREYSATPTAEKGGRLEWMALENLPPALRPAILALKPGEATAPMTLPNAVAVFMLRAIDDGGPVAQQAQTLGYATLALGATGSPEAAALAARAAAGAKDCDDLYTVAKDLPASRLVRVTPASQSAIPQDIALLLAHLDVGDQQVLHGAGGDVLVMLCSREKVFDEAKGETAPSRDDVRNRLQNDRITSYADGFLADLMASAVIVRK